MFTSIFLTFLVALNSFAEVESQKLSQVARQKISQVPEFEFIQMKAQEMGVKVYLFGGSAAAYAHYVRWNIELDRGSNNHQPERFDYDFTNIYRGNQDLDLVVDGTEAQALELQAILQEEYPHFVGDKQSWEVRLLSSSMGDKLPLLNDPDFKNQHTDTNSTGMLDLTAAEGEPVFRDLLDWENENSQFLQDVASARITYLFNPNHSTTSRFKEGKNPPIFSAVRYLAKLTQYEVTGRKEDLETIKRIIDETDFSDFSDYIKNKLGEFAIKTLLNSPNSEYAWDLMDKLDLREKLIQMDRNRIAQINTLSWWLNKEPLRSKDLGTEGKTAKDLFAEEEIILSHETNSFQAYENITRSSRGEANAFISRANAPGEAALHGDGFYTRRGLTGARGTGLTIRFKLHPNAREGEDFERVGDYIIIKNKKALTLIQENINISFVDFLILTRQNIKETDKGLLEKFKRKFSRLSTQSDEFREAVEFVKSYFDLSSSLPNIMPFFGSRELDFNPSVEYLLEMFRNPIDNYYHNDVIKAILNAPSFVWSNDFQLIEKLLFISDTAHDPYEVNEISSKLALLILKDDQWVHHQDALLQLATKYSHFQKAVLQKLLLNLNDSGKEFITKLVDQGALMENLLLAQFFNRGTYQNDQWFDYIVSNSSYASIDTELLVNIDAYMREELEKASPSLEKIELYEKWVNTIFNRRLSDRAHVKYILTNPHWHNRSDWLEIFHEGKNADKAIAEYILPHPGWREYFDEYLRKLINQKQAHSELLQYAFTLPYGITEIDLLENRLFANDYMTPEISKGFSDHIFTHPDFDSHQRFLKKAMLKRSASHIEVITDFAMKSPSPLALELITTLISSFDVKYKTLDQVLSEKLHEKHQFLRKYALTPQKTIRMAYPTVYSVLLEVSKDLHFLSKKALNTARAHHIFYGTFDYLALQVFYNEEWQQHPEILMQLIEKDTVNEFIIKDILKRKGWSKHPQLVLRLLEFKKYDDIIIKLLKQHGWDQHPEIIEAYFKNNPVSTLPSSWYFGGRILYNKTAAKDKLLAEYVLGRPHWKKNPEFLIQLIQRGLSDKAIEEHALSQVHWQNHSVLKAYVNSDMVMTCREF